MTSKKRLNFEAVLFIFWRAQAAESAQKVQNRSFLGENVSILPRLAALSTQSIGLNVSDDKE